MAKQIKYPFVLDISDWKGQINWEDVRPRPDLVICQASNGIQGPDDFLPFHWKNLRQMAIKRGAYHVFDPKTDIQLQIDNYLNAVEQAGGFDNDCIPPILDATNFQCNLKKVSIGKKIKQCLDEMQTYTKQTPIIQISRRYWSFLKDRKGNIPDWANEYYLWIPWYPSDPEIYKQPPQNTLPNGWGDWAIWKYDEGATISGITGYVSLSTLSETFAEQIGITVSDQRSVSPHQKRLIVEATIVASEGVIIRRQLGMSSKMLAFLSTGSKVYGEAIEFVSAHEAWLYVTKPLVGWCPIVHTGRTYLSLGVIG